MKNKIISIVVLIFSLMAVMFYTKEAQAISVEQLAANATAEIENFSRQKNLELNRQIADFCDRSNRELQDCQTRLAQDQIELISNARIRVENKVTLRNQLARQNNEKLDADNAKSDAWKSRLQARGSQFGIKVKNQSEGENCLLKQLEKKLQEKVDHYGDDLISKANLDHFAQSLHNQDLTNQVNHVCTQAWPQISKRLSHQIMFKLIQAQLQSKIKKVGGK